MTRSLLALVLLVGCSLPDTDRGFDEPAAEPTPAGDDDDSVDDAPSWWGVWDQEPGEVVLEEQLGESPGCVQPLFDCADDYFAFIDLAAEHARPISEELLEELIDTLVAGGFPQDGQDLNRGELAVVLGDALNLDFLLDGLNTRPLIARTVRWTEYADWMEEELVFIDPLVGRFHGFLLHPRTVDSAPVVAVHGHATEPADMIDFYGGAELVRAGTPVLALSLRVNYADDLEDQVQRSLLLSGFSIAQLRIYEVMLAARYLRARGDFAAERLGLLAHSGGASVMNLTVRLTDGFSAYVYDHVSDYADLRPGRYLLDSVLPDVNPYRGVINDFSTLPLPTLAREYGFPEDPAETVDFLRAQL